MKCPLVTQKDIRKQLPFSLNRCAGARDKKVENVLRENDLTGGLINAHYARSKAPSPVAAYGPRGGAKQSTPAKIRTGNVEQELEAKFKSAQAKATKVGVENLTKEDIDGLSSAQLKELRGY